MGKCLRDEPTYSLGVLPSPLEAFAPLLAHLVESNSPENSSNAHFLTFRALLRSPLVTKSKTVEDIPSGLTQTPFLPSFVKKFQRLGQLTYWKLPNFPDPCPQFVAPLLRSAGLLHDYFFAPNCPQKGNYLPSLSA